MLSSSLPLAVNLNPKYISYINKIRSRTLDARKLTNNSKLDILGSNELFYECFDLLQRKMTEIRAKPDKKSEKIEELIESYDKIIKNYSQRV